MPSDHPERRNDRYLVPLAYLGAVLGVGLIAITAANYALGWNVLPPSLLVIGLVLVVSAAAVIRQLRREGPPSR